MTHLGEELAARAGEILRAVDELEEFMRARSEHALGPLQLGIIPTVAPYLLPELITALHRRYPGIELRPREAVTQKLVESLLEGRLDAAILALPIGDPALSEMPFVRRGIRARPPGGGSGLSRAECRRLAHDAASAAGGGHCFREQALAFCTPAMAAPRDLIEGSSLSTLVQMVSAGIGVTLVPEMAVPVETRSARVALQRLAKPRPTRRIGMVWRKSTPLATALGEGGALAQEIMRRRSPDFIAVTG